MYTEVQSKVEYLWRYAVTMLAAMRAAAMRAAAMRAATM